MTGGGSEGYHVSGANALGTDVDIFVQKVKQGQLFSDGLSICMLTYCYCSVAYQHIHRRQWSIITWPESGEEGGDVLHARSSISKHLTLQLEGLKADSDSVCGFVGNVFRCPWCWSGNPYILLFAFKCSDLWFPARFEGPFLYLFLHNWPHGKPTAKIRGKKQSMDWPCC